MPDKYDNIRHILEELRNYTLTHFEHEEAYMESIHYERLPEQKRQHEALEETINDWDVDAIDENQDETIEEILRLVTNWLVNHILHEDFMKACHHPDTGDRHATGSDRKSGKGQIRHSG